MNFLKSFLFSLILLGQSCIALSQINSTQLNYLRDFPECFSISAASSMDLEKAEKIMADPPFFRLCPYTNTKEYLIFIFFPDKYADQLKQCYYNQNNIRGAVEMFNTENSVPLRRINSKIIECPQSPLIPDYLKHPFPKPSPKCRYESCGDIIKGNLKIFCTFHGSVPEKN